MEKVGNHINNCAHCRHGLVKVSVHTGLKYVECKFRQNTSDLSIEELVHLLEHSIENCNYEEGKPKKIRRKK